MGRGVGGRRGGVPGGEHEAMSLVRWVRRAATVGLRGPRSSVARSSATRSGREHPEPALCAR
ncbi:hypothetical protein MES4922_300148 [Mesorhizobium ventifaucium]|uniref:Uncharacterized protein n=1 Tax=Mesorhizobium ventifaucium TaxID=666020 RepID=A0ABN8K1M5_9HYPH|nr:hypothetical protein MES4922_300148 [Mesorhizobium ventifaucium]